MRLKLQCFFYCQLIGTHSYDIYIVLQANDEIILPIEITNLSGTQLQHLNEYCLLDIFSVKSLTLMDLCSVAETCTRFQQIVSRLIPNGISCRVNRNREIEAISEKCKRKPFRRNDVKRILKNFGSSMRSITIDNCHGVSEDIFLLNLVLKHYGDTLVNFNFAYQQVPDVLTLKLNAMLKQLKSIILLSVVLPDNKALFADCDELVELTVQDVENCGAILKNVFPRLRRFEYSGERNISELDDSAQAQHLETLTTFISRHPTLKILWLRGCHTNSNDVKILQVIVSSCKDLKKLDMDMDATNISQLQSLQEVKLLRSLKLIFYNESEPLDYKLFSNLKNLRRLTLAVHSLPNGYIDFDALNHLKKLHIFMSFNPNEFTKIRINRLTNLRRLRIVDVSSDETLKEFHISVKGRQSVLTLTTNLECSGNMEKNVETISNITLN